MGSPLFAVPFHHTNSEVMTNAILSHEYAQEPVG